MPICSGLRSGCGRLLGRPRPGSAPAPGRCLRREHADLLGDRQHVLKRGVIELLTQPGVLPIRTVAKDRRPGDLPRAARSTSSTASSGWFELDLFGDLRLATRSASSHTPPADTAPPQRHCPHAADRVHRHADLTVPRFPSVPEYWRLTPGESLPSLGNPVSSSTHATTRSPARRAPRPPHHQRRIPRTVRQELLQRLVVSVPAQPLGQRLKRLPSTLLQQPTQIHAPITNLRRPVHRPRQHLNPERLQPLGHHQRRINSPIFTDTSSHNSHHDLLAIGSNARRLRRKPSELLPHN